MMGLGFEAEMPGKGVYEVEVSRGSQNVVLLYCESGVVEGVKEVELESQALVIVEEPQEPRGRKIQLRARYETPVGWKGPEGWGGIVGEEGAILSPWRAKEILLGRC